MAERETQYSNPFYVRDKFHEVWSGISDLRETERQHAERITRLERLLDRLDTVVQGNAEIQHGGMMAQVSDMNKMVSEIKRTQEAAEKERERARDRWKWVFAGLGVNAVVNLGNLKPTIEWLGQLFGVGP